MDAANSMAASAQAPEHKKARSVLPPMDLNQKPAVMFLK